MTQPDQRDVSVNLNANVQAYQTAMQEAGRQTVDLTSKVATLAKGIDDLVKRTSRKLIFIGTAEIGSLAAAAEAANRLDIAFAQVRSTAAITGQSVGDLTSAARKLSQQLPASTGEIARLMGQIQDLGIQGTANIVRFTQVATKLAEATNTAPGQLLTGIVQLSRTMGSSYTDVERYSSALVSLSKQNGVSAQGILDFSNAIEAVATKAGLVQTQVLGISTAFAKAGADGPAAAQVFNRVMTDISTAVVTGSMQLTTYANLIGTTRDHLRNMARDNPADVFVKVVESLKALGNQGLIVQQQLGLDNPRTQRVLAALTSGQSDIGAAVAQSNEAFDKNTALSKAAGASYAQLSVAMEKFRSSIDNAVTSLGGPFLVVMTKVFEAGTKMINLFNNLPGPLKTAIGILGAVAASGTLLAGVVALIGFNVLKLGLVFRALTLQPITQAFNGLRSSMTGTREFDPKYMEGRTRAMQRMYAESYRLGNMLKQGSETPAGRGAGSVARSVGLFPVRKLRSEGAEFMDTLRNPYPSQRDSNKLSPYSLAGGAYQVKKAATSKRDELLASEDPRTARVAKLVFGDPEARNQAATEKLSTQAATLAAASRERVAAEREVLSILRSESAESIKQMMIAQEDVNNRKNKKYVSRSTSDISNAEMNQFINRRARAVGEEEFVKVKTRLEEEAGVEVSQIKKIFDRVTTMASDLANTTANGVTAAFNATKAGFAAAVEQIVALARLAQEQLNSLRGGGPVMGGQAYNEAMNVAKKELNIPQTFIGRVKSTADEVRTRINERSAPNPLVSTPGVIGSPGMNVTGYARAGQSVAQEAVATEEVAKHMSTLAQYGKIAGSGLVLAGRGAMSLGSSLMGLVGGPLGAAFLGFTVLLPVLDHFAHKGRDAAEKMGDFGEELAKSLGLAYSPYQQQKGANPAENNPFGQNEQQTARSGTFLAGHKGDITRFGIANNSNERVAVAQMTMDKIIENSNKGAPATETEKQAIRELLLQANNGDVAKAQADYNKLQLGQGGSDPRTRAGVTTTIQQMASRSSTGGLLPSFLGGGANSENAQALTRALGGNLTQAFNAGNTDQLAYLLASTGLGIGGKSGGSPGDFSEGTGAAVTSQGKVFQQQIKAFASQVNKGKSGSQKLNITDEQGDTAYDVPTFIADLQLGGKESKALAAQLNAAGGSVDSLRSRFEAVANDPNSLLNRMAGTSLGKINTQYGLGLTGANVQSQDYQHNIGFALAIAGTPTGQRSQIGNFDAATLGRQRLSLRQNMALINNPSDPVSQDYAQRAQALTGQIMAQKNQFATASESAQNYASEIGRVTQEMGSGASAQEAFNQAVGDFQGSVTQAEGQLRNMVQQVHDYQIQRTRGEAEHTLQLNRMYRDRGTQLTEIQYQENHRLINQAHDFNEQIRSSRYELSNIFGGAAQQLEAQYTVGGDTFLLGMNRQVDVMRRSKAAIDQLAKEGVSQDSIRVAGLDDPKNYEQAERLVGDFARNPKLVDSFNASIKNRLQIAEGLATDPNNAKFREMKRQFDYTAKQAAIAFQHSQEVSTHAYNVSLADFEQNYQISLKNAETDLQRTGENLYTNLNQLLAAGLATGVTNITTFTQGIQAALKTAQTGFQGFYAGMAAPTTGAPVAASQYGGNLSGGLSGGGTSIGDAPATIGAGSGKGGQGVGRDTYTNPGTGSVYGATRGQENKATGQIDYRPFDEFMRLHPANPGFNRSIARSMMPKWAGGVEWSAWDALWSRESGWNQYADNQTSDAYGIPQALPGGKMSSSGKDWRTNPATQIAWGIQYIQSRYGDPQAAWDHEKKVGWYAAGGVFESATNAVIGEAGPEAVIPLDRRGAEFVANILRPFMPTSRTVAANTTTTGEGSSTSLDVTPVQRSLGIINATLKEILAAIKDEGKAKGTTDQTGQPGAPKPSSNVVPGVPISSIVPPVTKYPGTLNPDGTVTVKPVLQPGQTGAPREGNGSMVGVDPRTGNTVSIMPGGGPMPTGSVSVGQISGTHDNTAVPNIIGMSPNPTPAQTGAYNAIENTVIPVQHPNAQGVQTDEQRAFSSFPAAAQAALLRGEHVTAGDGRIYALINGHATVIGFSSTVHNAAFPNSPITPVGGIINPYVAARAAGGPVFPRAPYLVGEKGPELFVPSMSGQIMNSQLTMSNLNAMRQQMYATPMGYGTSSSHSESNDHSTHIHGDVNVEANNTAELMRQMQQRKRLTNLGKRRNG